MIKVVYALSSDNAGYYPEQCLISLYTLQKYNPNIPVSVIMDSLTHSALSEKQIDAISQFSEVLVAEIPNEFNTERLRSRFIKTSVRRLVSGDFLFLDCDTLICRPFDEVDFCDIAIGMVADLNAPLPLLEPNTLSKCQGAGFTALSGAPYFNSGCFFVKDTPSCYHLFDTWHHLWQESLQRGCAYDQPSLCEANRQMDFLITELPGKWNCQIKFPHSRFYLQDAFVLHYFAAGGSSSRSFHEEALLKRVRDVGIDATVSAVILGKTDAVASFFCQKTDMALRYLGADMFSIFSEDPSIFRLVERIANAVKRIKRVWSSCF